MEKVYIDWLREVITRPGCLEARYLAGSGVRTDYHHGDFGGARIGQELCQHFVALYVRQVQIEQDQVGPVRARQLKTGLSPGRGEQFQAGLARDDAFDQPHVGKVVFYVEQRHGIFPFRFA